MELRRWKGMVKKVTIAEMTMNERCGNSGGSAGVNSMPNAAEVTDVVMTCAG